MLTEKCPSCGSYNDPSAFECYYCKKELPNPGKIKKKKKTQAEKKTVTFAVDSGTKRTNRPGCLMMYIGFLFLLCIAIVLLMINAAGGYLAIEIPPGYTRYATFLTNPINDPRNANLAVLLTQVLPITTAVIAPILSMGLFLLKPWARAMAMFFQALCVIGYIGFFYILLTRYYDPLNIPTEFVIVFTLAMTAIIAGLYVFVWFFERSKIFT
jgi:hypothetical protein